MKTLVKKVRKPRPYVLTVKLSPGFGRDLRAFANRLDTTLSDIVKASVRRAMNEGSVTLEPVEYMTPKLEASLAEIEEDIKHGRNVVTTASTDEEIDTLFRKIERGDYAN